MRDLREKEYSFVKYYYYVPNSRKIEPKISYFKLFKPWNWIIGTGVYLPDLEGAIQIKEKEKLQELDRAKIFIFTLIFAIMVIFAVTAFLVSRLLNKKINSLFKDFERALDESKFINGDKCRIKQIDAVAKNLNKAIGKFKEYERNIVEAFVNVVEARDIYTKGHSQRVAYYALVIAKSLGLDPEKQDTIYKAGLLHDIGKIGIPDNILLKPGKLTENEYNIIKYHSVFSYELLNRIEQFKDIAKCVRSHHERCDGSGYPDGLKCKDICIEARILAIADVFDALTTTRPYRKAFSPQEAIAILKKEQVDQEILRKVEDDLVNSFMQEDNTEIKFMSREIDKIRNEIFKVDYMTGLLFITAFIRKVKDFVPKKQQFIMFRVNIRHISEINYRFSIDIGNRVILDTAKALKQLANDKNKKEILLSRAYADVFFVAYPIDDKSEINDAIKMFSKNSLRKAIIEAILQDRDVKGIKQELLNSIDVSVSFAIYPQDGVSVEEILYKTERRMKEN